MTAKTTAEIVAAIRAHWQSIRGPNWRSESKAPTIREIAKRSGVSVANLILCPGPRIRLWSIDQLSAVAKEIGLEIVVSVKKTEPEA